MNCKNEKISMQVYKLLKICKIKSYPVNLRNVLEAVSSSDLQIELSSYKDYMRYQKIEGMFASSDGASVYIPEADFYILFFNDGVSTQGRMNWTIAHELGHIMLNHFDTPIHSAEKEKEADMFSEYFLSHPLILKCLNIDHPDDIKRLCNLSDQAAKVRAKQLATEDFTVNRWDKAILSLFEDFTSKRMCVGCRSIIEDKHVKYCIYCGSGDFVQDIDIFLSKNKITKISSCPRCDNTDIGEGNFCKICGLCLTTICRNCLHVGSLAETDRFCPVCGTPVHTPYLKHQAQ